MFDSELLLRHDRAILGERVVRVASLVIAVLAIAGGVQGEGGGAYLCWLATGLFLLAAAFPRQFGRIAGSAIMLATAIILLIGPPGQTLQAANLVLAVPFLLIAGLFMKPEIIDAAVALFKPSA